MLDFVDIRLDISKRVPVIYPEFITDTVSKDLMVRGGALYGIWDDVNKKWYTKKSDASRIIDRDINAYIKKHPEYQHGYQVNHMRDSSSGVMDRFNKFCRDQIDDNYVQLDSKLIFASDPYVRENYSTKRLPYDIVNIPTPGYDELMSTLYSEEERLKIEWLIGAALAGDNGKVQKFIVLYGDPMTGKSTVINIIQSLFDGYCAVFDAAALGNKSDSFALEPFKNGPIVAVQHDGNLSRINDNTRLNSIVSHEVLNVNAKYKAIYEQKFNTILFIGSNDPVQISNAKSGLLRRLIDVSPTGNRLPLDAYERCCAKIPGELGGIAYRCRRIYLKNKKLYDGYRPMSMMASTNDFYDYVLYYYDAFAAEEYTTLQVAWERYKQYVEDANVMFKMSRRAFANELNSYFEEGQHDEWFIDENGQRKHVSSVYRGFKKDQFSLVNDKDTPKVVLDDDDEPPKKETSPFDGVPEWLQLTKGSRENDILAKEFPDCPAQYASRGESEAPKKKWEDVTTTLKSIVTTEVHYFQPQGKSKNFIVLDFDKRGEGGAKDLRTNLLAASAFPKTYTEVSKGGSGLHLHYFYEGDVSELSRLLDDNVEIKVFSGKSALRRKLTLCNTESIAHLDAGYLPTRKEVRSSMIDWSTVKNDKALRTIIRRNLAKEYWPNTKPSIDLIKKSLDDAYASGLSYDVRDLRPSVMNFAANSTNNSDYCMGAVCDMHFCSKDVEDGEKGRDEPLRSGKEESIVFYDVEVFKNLFVICWKRRGSGGKETVIKMINPDANQVAEFIRSGDLVGFNNRDYDNHIIYARLLGYTNEQLYECSQRIISNSPNAKFAEAYNLSYTDVYDFSNTKQSLKKWEIELGIHHHELGIRWDSLVPEDMFETVADYCCDDVLATEAVFEHLKGDWYARQVLAKITGKSVNTTTNSLSAALIFGNDKNPQKEFVYTNLSMEFPGYEFSPTGIDKNRYVKDENGKPIYAKGLSIYMNEDPSEGGYVYAKPGIHYNVALLDIASLHPTTIECLNLFGDRYTARFSELKACRIAVKHKNWEEARSLLDGALVPFLENVEELSQDDQQALADDLAYALKIVINSIYGLTSAKFPNRFKDPRNVDNIVAKRGALFMITLKNEVQKRGFNVAHIKTDSIKIPDATPEIIDFVMNFGKKYGYTFEHEATYAKMCLVNDAVYIAKYDECGERTKNGKHANCWTATGAQFKVPYVFKTLFSHEPIEFGDLCETKSVSGSGAIYLDMDEDLCDEREDAESIKNAFEKEHSEITVSGSGKRKRVFDTATLTEEERKQYNDILSRLEALHSYQFVGRVGLFCPMMPGSGGGTLLRAADGKYSSVTGTKGYRWMEAEIVKNCGLEGSIDRGYYRELVDKAAEMISKYGDVDEFVESM